MCESYDITHTDLNPTVFFIGKNNNVTTNRPHSHDNTEILFVMSGTCQEIIDGVTYEVCAGDVIMVNAGQTHSHVVTSSADPVIMFFVGFYDYHFKGMDANRFDFPNGSPIFHTEGLIRQDISNLCLKMLSERYSNQVGQYFMQKSYLTQLLLMLIRQIILPSNDVSSSYHFETHHKTYVVSEIRQYLSDHYS